MLKVNLLGSCKGSVSIVRSFSYILMKLFHSLVTLSVGNGDGYKRSNVTKNIVLKYNTLIICNKPEQAILMGA